MTISNEKISIERTLTQGDFDQFATLSGDHNPIHVDPEFAANSRFGRTVSHGLLLNSILRGLLDQLVPGGRQLSQELRSIEFSNRRTKSGARLAARSCWRGPNTSYRETTNWRITVANFWRLTRYLNPLLP